MCQVYNSFNSRTVLCWVQDARGEQDERRPWPLADDGREFRGIKSTEQLLSRKIGEGF